MEGIHAAAYRDNTLGLPKICPQENIEKIDRNTLYTYLSSYHKPDRIVVAGMHICEIVRHALVVLSHPLCLSLQVSVLTTTSWWRQLRNISSTSRRSGRGKICQKLKLTGRFRSTRAE